MKSMALIGGKKFANIEIQDYVIRYAEMKNNKKSAVVTHCDEYYIPKGVVENGHVVDEELFVKTLKYCVRKWKLRGKKIRFIVPDSSVIIRTIDVPADTADEELTGYIYFELGHSVHLPFENPIVDAISLGVIEDKKQALVVASSEEVVDSYYDFFKGERALPVVADVSALCQYRLFHHYGITNENDIYMLAQFDVKSASISVFEQHKPIFMQEVTIPYVPDTWKVAALSQGGILSKEQFNRDNVLSAISDIYTEMERILRFYQYTLRSGEKQVTKILLTGDHPFMDEIFEGMQMRLETPVQTLAPDKIQVAQDMEVDTKYYNVLGLALKEGV